MTSTVGGADRTASGIATSMAARTTSCLTGPPFWRSGTAGRPQLAPVAPAPVCHGPCVHARAPLMTVFYARSRTRVKENRQAEVRPQVGGRRRNPKGRDGKRGQSSVVNRQSEPPLTLSAVSRRHPPDQVHHSVAPRRPASSFGLLLLLRSAGTRLDCRAALARAAAVHHSTAQRRRIRSADRGRCRAPEAGSILPA